jgi:hypothetical protein
VNGPGQISPVADDGKPRKKRGRPSKEEHDRRVHEASLRGEVYPKPRKPKTARPSFEGQGMEAVEMIGSGGPAAMTFGTRNTAQTASTSPASSRQDMDPTTIIGGAVPAGQVAHEGGHALGSASIRPQLAPLGSREGPMTETRQLAVMPETRDVEMGQPEASPGSGPVPGQPGYALPGLPTPGTQSHETPMHHVQAHGPQPHEIHQQHGQAVPAPGQTPSHEVQSTEDHGQQHRDASGNVP